MASRRVSASPRTSSGVIVLSRGQYAAISSSIVPNRSCNSTIASLSVLERNHSLGSIQMKRGTCCSFAFDQVRRTPRQSSNVAHVLRTSY